MNLLGELWGGTLGSWLQPQDVQLLTHFLPGRILYGIQSAYECVCVSFTLYLYIIFTTGRCVKNSSFPPTTWPSPESSRALGPSEQPLPTNSKPFYGCFAHPTLLHYKHLKEKGGHGWGQPDQMSGCQHLCFRWGARAGYSPSLSPFPPHACPLHPAHTCWVRELHRHPQQGLEEESMGPTLGGWQRSHFLSPPPG